MNEPCWNIVGEGSYCIIHNQFHVRENAMGEPPTDEDLEWWLQRARMLANRGVPFALEPVQTLVAEVRRLRKQLDGKE